MNNDTAYQPVRMVGRDKELEVLNGFLEKTETGEGKLIFIEGEAGIGKTRLVEEFCVQAKDQIITSHIELTHEDINEPYSAFSTSMASLFSQFKDLDSLKIGDILAEAPDVLYEMIPSLAGASQEGKMHHVVHDLQMERDRLFETLYRLICRLASTRSIILVMDGIQYIDRTSLQLLHYVARTIHDHKLLLIVTYRPEELPDYVTQTIRLMNREKLYERLDLEKLSETETKILIENTLEAEVGATISLKGLNEEETSQLVHNALGKKEMADSLTSPIFEETQGNPLFVLEILRNITEEKGIVSTEDGLSIEIDLSKLALPKSIIESILRRKERLSENGRNIIEIASLFSGRFNYALLEISTGLDEESLSLSIDELVKKDMLIELGDDEENYIFKNPKVKEVIRENLDDAKIPELSINIAESLETINIDKEDRCYELATHYLAAKDWGKALFNLLTCVEMSKRSFAIDEAIEYSKKALVVLGHFEKDKEKLGTAGNIRLGLGEMLANAGEIDLANENYESVINIAHELEDNKILSLALLRKGILKLEKNEWELSKKDLNDAIKIAGNINDIDTYAQAKRQLGRIHWMNGEYVEANSLFQEAIKLSEDIDDQDLTANCYVDLGNVSISRGDREEVRAYYNEAIQIFSNIGNLYGLARVYNNIGCSYQESGDIENAVPHFQKCIDIAEKSGYIHWLPYGYEGLGLCKTDMGDLDEAASCLDKGLNYAVRLSNKYEIASIYQVYGDLYRAKKEWSQSEDSYLHAIKILEEINQQYYLAAALFEYSKMLKEKGDDEKAIEQLLRAKDIWTELGSKDRLLQITETQKEWGMEIKEEIEKEEKIEKEKLYKSEYVGRDDEISRLTKHIEHAVGGDGNFVFIEGEAGIGKTRLVNEVLESIAEKHGLEILFGRCLEGSTPYLPFIQALDGVESKKDLGLNGKISLFEEVFLVADTGLLITHHTRRLKPNMDSDIMAGMFTAVQHFIKDSFRTGQDDKLNEFKYGDQNIIIEHGDGFYLTVVISGNCSDLMRNKMEDTVMDIGNRFGSQIREWDGDLSALKVVDSVLKNLFEIKLIEEKKYKIDPKDAQEKVFDTIVSSLVQISKKRPMVLFLDDIQWMDDSSLSLMYHLSKKIQGENIFAVGTFRPEDLDTTPEHRNVHPLTRTIRKMGTDRLYSRITLNRLGKDSIQKMMDSMFPDNKFTNKLLDLIYAESGGNPFFTEEILASLVEEGLIYRSDGYWSSEAITKTKLPATIQDVILRRVDRLERDQKKLLEYSSVIGLQFEFETLLTILDTDEDELLVMLDDLITFKLIQETGDGEAYTFDHSTIQEVVYDNLSKSIRKVMHKKVANGIEDLNKNNLDDYTFELAKHYQQTRDLTKAFEYTIRSAEQAEGTYALADATIWYEKSLELVEKIFSHEEARKEKMRIVNKIGHLYYERGIMDASLKYTIISKELAEEEGNISMIAENLRNLGHIHRFIGNYTDAGEHYKKAIELSREEGDSRGIADSQRGLGYIAWRGGNTKEAIEYYESALGEARKIGDEHIVSQTYIEMGNAYNHWNQSEKAIEYYMKSIGELIKLNDFYELARAYNNIGDTYLQMKEWEKSIESFDRCREVSDKIGNKNMVAWAMFNSSEALVHIGQLDKAEKNCMNALNICETQDDKIGMNGVYRCLGIVYRFKENWDKAIENFNKSIAILGMLDIPYDLGDTYLQLGITYEDMGEIMGAKQNYQLAEELFDTVGAKNKAEEAKDRLTKVDNQ